MAERTAADRIREYKQLLDEGMITQEEFEAKKKQILESDEPHYERNENRQDPYEHYQNGPEQGNIKSSTISAAATGVLAYIFWIGFLIAYFAGDRENAKFHLNQGLVVNLFGLLTLVPVAGKIWGVFILVLRVIGIVNASQGKESEVPLLGGIRLL